MMSVGAMAVVSKMSAAGAVSKMTSMAIVKTAAMAACKDPTDAERALYGVYELGSDFGKTVSNLGYAAWERDPSYLKESGRKFIYIPVHAADVIVYSLSALTSVVPKLDVVLPIGYIWTRIRGDNMKQEDQTKKEEGKTQ